MSRGSDFGEAEGDTAVDLGEQILVLKQAHRKIRDKRLADRIKAVLSLNAGDEYSQVARILLLDEVTLHRYGLELDTLLTDNFQVIPALNLQT